MMFQFVSRVYFLGVNIRRIKLYLCQHQLSKHDTYAVLNKFFLFQQCLYLSKVYCATNSKTNFPQVL